MMKLMNISFLIKFVILLTVVTTVSSIGFSQSVTLKADRDSIVIGEPVQLTISVRKKDQASAIWPAFTKGDSLPKGFEVLEVLPKQVSNNKNDLVTQQLTITSFNPGNHFIDPIIIQDSNGVITSNVLMIKVGLIDADTTQTIRDIKPIKEPQITFSDHWWSFVQWLKANWYIALAILVGLVLLIWFLFFKKKKDVQEAIDKPIVQEPKIPAHIKALKTLAFMREHKSWETEDLKTYNDKLTDVVKEYIEDRYEYNAKERTTNEILYRIDKEAIPEIQRQNLKKLLTLSDLVKFAKQKPSEEENISILNDAVDFVNTTKLDKQ